MNLDEAKRVGVSASDEAFLATSQSTNAHSVAAMAVVVDTKDQAAVRFYRHFDFRPLQRAPMRLCLPMTTVAALLS
jgi:hypothetical protein